MVSLLDDGPTLQELADAAGIELVLPEPGDLGCDLQTLVQLYWPDPPPQCEERCPVCGGTGPDVYEPGEYGGAGDLRCGDEWHFEVVDGGSHRTGIDSRHASHV